MQSLEAWGDQLKDGMICAMRLCDKQVGSMNDETMDVEPPASPRREQRRLLNEASEALAERSRAAASHGPAGGEAPLVRRFTRGP